LNLTLTYAPLVNGGYTVEPHSVTEIRDKNGTILFQKWPQRQPVLDERLAYIVTNMLQGVQGIRNMPFDVAGKTGTSDKFNTVFVGYTSDMVATVFFGFDNPSQATELGNAVSIAAPAWRDLMTRIYSQSSPPPFSRPPGLEEATVCRVSGQLATHLCPDPYVELFMPGTAPRTYCEVHSGNTVEICSLSGMPANPYCPADLRITVNREPWMRYMQCPIHGPDPGEEQGDEPGDGEDDEDENDD